MVRLTDELANIIYKYRKERLYDFSYPWRQNSISSNEYGDTIISTDGASLLLIELLNVAILAQKNKSPSLTTSSSNNVFDTIRRFLNNAKSFDIDPIKFNGYFVDVRIGPLFDAFCTKASDDHVNIHEICLSKFRTDLFKVTHTDDLMNSLFISE